MSDNLLNYAQFMDRAFRSVIAEAMAHVAEHGLPGEHHFYITFRSDHPGVEMPDWLREEHPTNLSIVLQHEFYDLTVEKEFFSVQLTFRDRPASLRVPLDAVEIFADPAVQFGLRFQQEESTREEDADSAKDGARIEELSTEDDSKVVSLDAFRH